MKIESMEDGYKIFVHNIYFDSINWHLKSEIEELLREVLERVCQIYKIKLRGFYRIRVYPSGVGTFMEILKIDDESYDANEVDFRIVVVFNKDMYFKTDNVDMFLTYDKYYHEGYYYINLLQIEDFLSISEFGEVVFDEVIDFSKSIFIKGI